MNQLQLMSVCARNDFLVIQASQTRRAAERQLDKQPDRQTDRGTGKGRGRQPASQAGRKIDIQTDRQTQHTYIRQGRRIEMKRNEDELSHGAVDAGPVRGRGGGQCVRPVMRSFIRHSFSSFGATFFLSCVMFCFASLFFICLRVLKCVARKSKESWWVVRMWMLFVAHLALLVVVVVAFLILHSSSWHAKAKGK